MSAKKKFIILLLVLFFVSTAILFVYLMKIGGDKKFVLNNPEWKQNVESEIFERAIVAVEETVRGISLSRQDCEKKAGQFWCINYYKFGPDCFKNKIGVGERNYKEWHDYWTLQKGASVINFDGISGYRDISSKALDLTSVYLDDYSFTVSISSTDGSDCSNSSEKLKSISSEEIMNILVENINKYYK